jgi:hypothetical protein
MTEEKNKSCNDQSEIEVSEDQGEIEESPIVQIFTRAIEDQEFKQLLIENPDEALKGYELSEIQMIMVKNLSAEDIERLTPEYLEEFFSADAAVYTPDEDEVLGEETYSPEDFEDMDDIGEYEEDI